MDTPVINIDDVPIKTSKNTFSKLQTNINLERLKEQSSSFFNFLNKLISKKEVVSMTLYKSDMIFAISDSCIVVYDSIHECLKYEVNV